MEIGCICIFAGILVLEFVFVLVYLVITNEYSGNMLRDCICICIFAAAGILVFVYLLEYLYLYLNLYLCWCILLSEMNTVAIG